MEKKTFIKKDLKRITLSTIILCATCVKPTKIHESLWTDDEENYYHISCAPRTKDPTPVVHSLELSDGLGIESK